MEALLRHNQYGSRRDPSLAIQMIFKKVCAVCSLCRELPLNLKRMLTGPRNAQRLIAQVCDDANVSEVSKYGVRSIVLPSQ